MNCRDVTEILDDQKLDRLDAAQRQQVEAHAAVCADCARVWHLQAALATLPDIAPSVDFAAHCRTLVAAGFRPAASGRTGTRLPLVVALVALAAAAAMLIFQLRPTASVPAADAVRIVEAQADVASPAVAPVPVEPGAKVLPAVAAEAAAALPLFTVHVVPYEIPTSAKLEADGLPEAERSYVLSMAKLNTSDPARVQVLQSLYAALIAELHGVAGLALAESDPKEPTSSSKHFRLKLQFLTMSGADGEFEPIDARYVLVDLGTEQLQPVHKNIYVPRSGFKIDLQAHCSGTARSADAPCNDVRGVAMAMVEQLRQEVFPPDSSVTHPLQARFRDSSLDPAERLKTLAELLQQQAKLDDISLLRDPGVVRAAIEMAGDADPVRRAQIWRSMRGAGNPNLIEPLINSLLQDPDDVQLAAIETLAADFTADPRVRSALQSVAGGDSRPLVRAVAERGLSGEEGWRRYVRASIKDTNQSAAQRIEALVYYLYPPAPEAGKAVSDPDYWRNMKEVLDDAAVRTLAEILPDASASLRGRSQRGYMRLFVSNFAGQYDKYPAVTDMLLRYLEHDVDPRFREVVVQELALAASRRDQPRVREALNKAMVSDPDPGVREWIRKVLGQKAP